MGPANVAHLKLSDFRRLREFRDRGGRANYSRTPTEQRSQIPKDSKKQPLNKLEANVAVYPRTGTCFQPDIR
jgi:hypothetical protein